jgi:hypothetical protein
VRNTCPIGIEWAIQNPSWTRKRNGIPGCPPEWASSAGALLETQVVAVPTRFWSNFLDEDAAYGVATTGSIASSATSANACAHPALVAFARCRPCGFCPLERARGESNGTVSDASSRLTCRPCCPGVRFSCVVVRSRRPGGGLSFKKFVRAMSVRVVGSCGGQTWTGHGHGGPWRSMTLKLDR